MNLFIYDTCAWTPNTGKATTKYITKRVARIQAIRGGGSRNKRKYRAGAQNTQTIGRAIHARTHAVV